MKLWGILILCVLLAGCGSDFERERLDLSGAWQTKLGVVELPGTTDESGIGDTAINWSETAHLVRRYSYVGALCYKRDVVIPKSMEGKHLELRMERTRPSTLIIDGDTVGSLGHLHTPHVYDISGLTPGQHEFKIVVDNSAILSQIGGSHAVSEQTQTNWNGILGKFEIVAMSATYIEDLQVFPNVKSMMVEGYTRIFSPVDTDVLVSVRILDGEKVISTKQVKCGVVSGSNEINIEIPVDAAPLWSEFERNLLSMELTIESGEEVDRLSRRFGMRDFGTSGKQFVVNDKRTFLRGKHDACVFPLTGYAPMDKESWVEVLTIAKSYGINHYRFHSWTPPAAAFEAADEVGIYMEPELPYWGCIEGTDTALCEFLVEEGFRILDEYGNHPSFVMMTLGNELCGDTTLMAEWVDGFRRHDNRHLYAFGANNFLGYFGPKSGEDFFVGCRVGGEETGKYNTHVRGSFSFADAYDGGIINGTKPNTRMNYNDAIKDVDVPVISHESCQFQIYPDYAEIEKYTGVLKPVNLENFRKGLEPNGLSSYADDFHRASGALAMRCYKADIEMCLRTDNFGGFQLLDLQDYPGQGSALVGVLDAFMDSKGLITADEFQRFCGEVVPLICVDRLTFGEKEVVEGEIKVANYGSCDLKNAHVICKVGEEIVVDTYRDIEQGRLSLVGEFSHYFGKVDVAGEVKIEVSVDNFKNDISVWVYPKSVERREMEGLIFDELNALARERLAGGGSVVLVPRHEDVMDCTVGGLFTPDYWNYAMFKKISENIDKPVSPGTLGFLVDTVHFRTDIFPTSYHSDFQWWLIAKNTRPLILDGSGSDLRPVVMGIDNVNRNHKLGGLMCVRVGDGGRLVICMTDLDAIDGTPEGVAYRDAVLSLLESDFSDYPVMSLDEVEGLFRIASENVVEGVDNISDYKKPE